MRANRACRLTDHKGTRHSGDAVLYGLIRMERHLSEDGVIIVFTGHWGRDLNGDVVPKGTPLVRIDYDGRRLVGIDHKGATSQWGRLIVFTGHWGWDLNGDALLCVLVCVVDISIISNTALKHIYKALRPHREI